MLAKGFTFLILACLSILAGPEQVWALDTVTSSVHGTVLDGQGRKLDGAEILLIPANGAEKKMFSSANGGYEFKDLPVGFYSIETRLKGFRENRRFFFLREGESHSLDICLQVLVMIDYLKPSVITCTVQSSDGNSIKGATVTLLNPYDQQVAATGYTNNRGQVSLQTSYAGHHIVYAYKEGYKVGSIFLDVAWDKSYEEKIVLLPNS